MTRAPVSSAVTKRRSTSDTLSIVTGELTRLLERGVLPWRAPWDPTLALAATPGLPLRFTGEPYRGANVVLLWAAQIARAASAIGSGLGAERAGQTGRDGIWASA